MTVANNPSILTELPTKSEAPRGRLLIDARPITLQVVERADGSNKVIVRGEFARCNAATENNRVYPGKLWEREFNRLGKSLTEKQVFGELDHPSDGRTSLTRVSHVVTNLGIEDGIVVGEAEILDTERGRTLKALLKSGCKVGVSSRGYGSTKANEKGEDIVQDDYRLVTFDFVAEPADSTAYPDVFFEGKEPKMGKELSLEEKTALQIEEARRDERKRLHDEFQRELLNSVAAAKADVKEVVRGELLSDPSVAGARTALEQICTMLRPYGLSEEAAQIVKHKDEEINRLKNEISERDLKIRTLEGDLTKVSNVAREAGYRFFLERALTNNPDSDLVRKLLGDITQYKTLGDLKSKMEGAIGELNKKREAQKQEESRKEAKSKAAEKQIVEMADKYKTRIAKLEEALNKTAEVNKSLSLRLYTEKKLVGNPKAEKLRPMLESVKVDSKDDIDTILDRFDTPDTDSEVLESVRSRVRKVTNGGRSTRPELEEKPLKESSDFNGLGLSITALQALSGIKK